MYGAAIGMETGAKLHLNRGAGGRAGGRRLAGAAAKERLAEWLGAALRWPVEFEGTVWTGIPLFYAILMGGSAVQGRRNPSTSPGLQLDASEFVCGASRTAS